MILDDFRAYLGSLTNGYLVQFNRWDDEPLDGDTDTQNTRSFVIKMDGGLKPDVDYFTSYAQIYLIGAVEEGGIEIQETMEQVLSFMMNNATSEKFAIIEPVGMPSGVIYTEEQRPVTTLNVRLIVQL